MEDSSGTLHFGKFNLETRDRRLSCDGHEIYLRPKTYDTLLYLVGRSGHLVTKNDLLDAVWEGVEVGENALTRCIKEVRAALGDDIHNPHFIRTVPRLGYEFVAPVENLAEPESSDGAVEEPTPSGTVTDEGAADVHSSKTPIRRKLTGASVPQTPSHARVRANLRKAAIWLAAAVLVAVAVSLGFNLEGLRERILGEVSVPRVESVAVLPLENLSGDPEQEYFADGMTEELITDLGRISALRVISRTSVMQYKGTKKPVPQIGRELNVDAIVEGTVRRSGNRVRITANLLYAPSDRHLWAQSYERNLGDVLSLQDEVARAIASEVGFKLMYEEQARLAKAHPVNPQAYQACLKGKYYTNQWTEGGWKKATASFQEALDFDPTYAPAYEGLAEVFAWRGTFGLQPSNETFPLARAAALKALELDNGLAESHAVLGVVMFQFDWDWAGAEQELKRAVMLSPNNSTAHLSYGAFLTSMGRADEAIAETRKALELDPLTPTTNVQLGWALYYARRYDLSIAHLKKTLQLAPDFAYAHGELGWDYAQKRMYADAVAECERTVSLMPEEQVTLGSCGNVFGLAGRHQDALKLLGQLKKLSTRGYVDPYNVAWLYDGLGDIQSTMDWLERAYTERSASLYALRIEPWTDRLRSDPRFQDLLRRMNFPP